METNERKSAVQAAIGQMFDLLDTEQGDTVVVMARVGDDFIAVKGKSGEVYGIYINATMGDDTLREAHNLLNQYLLEKATGRLEQYEVGIKH